MINLDNLDINSLNKMIQNIDTFIFDCDGVIWNRDKLIEKSNLVIEYLNKLNKQVLFVTNSSTKTSDILFDKFTSFNIPAERKNIIHAGLATVFYINTLNLQPKSEIYLIGSNNLYNTIMDNNIHNLIISGLEDNDKKFNNLANDNKLAKDLFNDITNNRYKAVIIGWDNYFNTFKLAKASSILKYQKNCHFISSNNDFTAPFNENVTMPASGSIIKSIELSCNRKSKCVGKPSIELANYLINHFHLNPNRTCMVGDRIDSDLYFGKNANFKTLIVLSGVTSLDELKNLQIKNRPDYYSQSIMSLCQ